MLFNLIKKLLITIFIILQTGCQLYRLEVKQGNELEIAKLNKLVSGMSKAKVEEILGIPALTPQSPDRLDYYYSIKDHKNKLLKQQHITLYFDDGRLSYYEGDFVLKYVPTTTLQNIKNKHNKPKKS